MPNLLPPSRRRLFFAVWFGQVVSQIGSSLTSFALGLWVYQQTGSVTAFALLSLCRILPAILMAPLAGVLIDRWDRRWTMILSDTGAALCTLGIAGWLLTGGHPTLWPIYLALGLSAVCNTFQAPAYLAATTTMVNVKDLGRVGGLMQIGQAATEILAPTLAGLLMVTFGLASVLLVDMATFLFAVTVVLAVRFPPAAAPAPDAARSPLAQDLAYGLRYLVSGSGLMGLLLYFTAVNFLGGMIGSLAQPMFLAFASPAVLGVIFTLAGGGYLLGSVVISAWGGPRRRVDGVLGFGAVFAVGLLCLGGRPSVLLAACGAFTAHFALPFINGLDQAIWQSRVAAPVQGRVFALKRMVSQSVQPLAILAAGPLADRVFEPLMRPGGLLAQPLGGLLGTGPGRGIGLMFILMGSLMGLLVVAGLARLRQAEDALPPALVEVPAAVPEP